tara:strand:+ start:390 stop:629 length:240 start_codon:yes stop_codon:yes gene_type:complete
MALQQREILVSATVRENGNIDCRTAKQVYDDSITPVVADLENGIDGVTDVIASENFRYVVQSNEATPANVQAFLDNSKA